MAYVQVDVDIDEFDTYELVDELCRRLKKDASGRKKLTDKQKAELKEVMTDLTEILLPQPELIEVVTLEDKMKYDHLVKVFGKYSSSQMEKALPE